MARILPNQPAGRHLPEVTKVYQTLKTLPDSTYIVWQRLHLWLTPGPDFLVLDDQQRVLLIKVSPITRQQAALAGQRSLFDTTNTAQLAVGAGEQAVLETFVQQLELSPAAHLPLAVIFPNLSTTELQPHRPALPGLLWGDKAVLQSDQFAAWVARHSSAPLAEGVIQRLRSAFTPEIVIPPEITVRQPIVRHTQPELTPFLLDYNQEWAMKLDLDLSLEAEQEGRNLTVRVINGVAGSGKSLIVLYRAHLLRQAFPHKPMLVLTHNRPLINDLQQRYQRLTPSTLPLEWRTFLGWCRKHWPTTTPWHEPISRQTQREIIQGIHRAYLAGTAMTEEMLLDEISWLKDQRSLSRATYLVADRTGRGFGLIETMRGRVFDAAMAYQHELQRRNLADWHDVPRRLWLLASEQQVVLPQYESILIDEAQFFAPIWFDLIRQSLTPTHGYLFLVADPTQGFLRRGQSWLSLGLEVRGRSHRLDRSYRTTREILTFATRLYELLVPDDQEERVLPRLHEMPHGSPPEVVQLGSPQDEITRVVNELIALDRAGTVPRQHVLVIHAGWQGAATIRQRLAAELGAEAVIDPKDRSTAQAIRVTHLNAATGLEAPLVFVMGTHTLFEAMDSLRLGADERAALVRDNARRLYMALTRAGQRLVITYVGALPETLLTARGAAQRVAGVGSNG